MRMLHTMLRVTNLERSIEFYTEVLGMKLLRQSDNPEIPNLLWHLLATTMSLLVLC